jgi:hypothetical protein
MRRQVHGYLTTWNYIFTGLCGARVSAKRIENLLASGQQRLDVDMGVNTFLHSIVYHAYMSHHNF